MRGFFIFAQFVFKMTQQKDALLVLEDGTTCYGQAFGAIGTTGGEICFNTGMTGYQEIFTDPSYYGQVLIMNNVHIGNYGVKDEDVQRGRTVGGSAGVKLDRQDAIGYGGKSQIIDIVHPGLIAAQGFAVQAAIIEVGDQAGGL